jgi:hypothetical protein
MFGLEQVLQNVVVSAVDVNRQQIEVEGQVDGRTVLFQNRIQPMPVAGNRRNAPAQAHRASRVVPVPLIQLVEPFLVRLDEDSSPARCIVISFVHRLSTAVVVETRAHAFIHFRQVQKRVRVAQVLPVPGANVDQVPALVLLKAFAIFFFIILSIVRFLFAALGRKQEDLVKDLPQNAILPSLRCHVGSESDQTVAPP